jgi:hypothetical protein
VETRYEIVGAVGALPVEEPAGGSTKLAIGVGIATGEADWSALAAPGTARDTTW